MARVGVKGAHCLWRSGITSRVSTPLAYPLRLLLLFIVFHVGAFFGGAHRWLFRCRLAMDWSCLRPPEIGRVRSYFVGRVADFRDEAVNGGLCGLDRFRACLQAFVVAFVAQQLRDRGNRIKSS